MGLFVSLIAALALWTILWGTSIMKSFDAFLLSMVIVLLAAATSLIVPHLPGGRR